MMRKSYQFSILIRLVLLGLAFVLEYAVLKNPKYPASSILIGLVIVFQIIDLIHIYNKNNRELKRFFDAIEYADFSQSFSSLGMGKSYEDLSRSFSNVMERFQDLRMEKEEQFQYLQTVIRNISTGMIAFDEAGHVTLFNHSAKKMLGVPMIRHLDELASVCKELYNALKNQDPKKTSVVKCVLDEELKQFSLNSTFFKQKGETLTLVSIQDIGSEMEEQEIQAWQKLIRVLTHEIMNSITPISSMSSTMTSLLKQSKEIDGDLLDDLKDTFQTISSRSEGLKNFVSSYRSLTRLPVPSFKVIEVDHVIQSVIQLLQEELKRNKVQLKYEVSEQSLQFAADGSLIEQVLINLVLNAIQALTFSETKEIVISTEIDHRNRVLIHVKDTGPGIDSDVVEKIFIPFFSTKKEGSGIGLSLSRQIMRLHKGHIFVKPNHPYGAVFTLRF